MPRVQATGGDHAHSEPPATGGNLARAAPLGDEYRNQRDAETQGAELLQTELFKDLDRAVEFDQSQAFKKLYETNSARRRRTLRSV